MHRSSFALVALVIAAAPLAAQRPAPMPADSVIRAILADRVNATHAGGIVVGVIDPDGRRRVVAYGASGTLRPLDAESVFEIGSVTKTFTATVLADMARRGEVALDDPVAKLLPGVTVPSKDGRQITLLDLATQSSGLPRMPGNFAPADAANPYADYTRDRLYAFLASYALPRAPGAQYEYSNLGFGLLGDALARRAGTDYATLVARRITDPSGMRDTRVVLTPSMRERLARGHDASGAAVANWDMASLAGAGALRSTMHDMLDWTAANMAADVDSTRGPLAAAMHAAHVARRPTDGEATIGLAWHRNAAPDGDTVVWHNGGTGGYRSFVGYLPRRHVAVVLLANSAVDQDDLAGHLLFPDRPLRPLRAPGAPTGPARTEIALPAATLDRYVGEYELTPQFHITVRREGAGLVAQATNQPPFAIFAERENAFFLKVVDAQLTFDVDASGAVTGLVLHQNGGAAPGKKIR